MCVIPGFLGGGRALKIMFTLPAPLPPEYGGAGKHVQLQVLYTQSTVLFQFGWYWPPWLCFCTDYYCTFPSNAVIFQYLHSWGHPYCVRNYFILPKYEYVSSHVTWLIYSTLTFVSMATLTQNTTSVFPGLCQCTEGQHGRSEEEGQEECQSSCQLQEKSHTLTGYHAISIV